MTGNIHPTALVAPDAELGEGVEVGAHAVIGAGVEIRANPRIGPQAVILGPTRLANQSRPPASAASMSIITCVVLVENAPVTTGLSEYSSVMNKRYRSPISLCTALQTTAVLCAPSWGN